MNAASVAIVHLGRAGSMGAARRVQGLTKVFELAGARVHEVRLRTDHAASVGDVRRFPLAPLARGRAVPEILSWSSGSARAALDDLAPDVVICETSRAYHPSFVDGPWHLVLDYVDRLSVSYRDRATILGRTPKHAAFRALGATAARFEGTRPPAGVRTIAAGYADAEALGATWVPITFELHEVAAPAPAHDFVFFGNLSYPPNIEAVQRLDRVWPRVRTQRPEATMLLAGAHPRQDVRDAASRWGWTLAADFDAIDDVLADARLVVVPLVHASGIQTKVLEAAAAGRPQLVDPVAIAGMQPGFPAAVASSDDELVAEMVRLASDQAARDALGRAALEHIASTYTAAAWAPWARDVLGRGTR